MLDHIHAARTGEHGKFDKEGWTRQQQTGVSADGGYLVYPEYLEMLTQLEETYGVSQRLFRIVRMGKNVMNLPVLDTRPTAQWVDEGVGPGESGPLTAVGGPTSGTLTEANQKTTFVRPALTTKRLMLLDTISGDVDEDSAPSLGDILPDIVALSFAKEKDRVAFNGRAAAQGGSDPFSGLLWHPDVQVLTLSGTAFSGLSYDNLVDCIDTPSPFALGNARWLYSTSLSLLIRKIKDSQDRPLWQEMAMGDPNTLFGFPIERSEVMPTVADTAAATGFVAFGDFRFFAMGIRNDFQLDFSREADFRRGNVVMRAQQRVAFVPLIGNAMARIVTHA